MRALRKPDWTEQRICREEERVFSAELKCLESSENETD